MIYTIDLHGNVVEVANAGAAALRQESAAAASATSEVSALAGAVAALASSTSSIQGLAAALKSTAPAFSQATDADFKKSPWENAGKKPAEPVVQQGGAVEGALAGLGEKSSSAGKKTEAAFTGAGGAIKGALAGLVALEAGLAGLHSLSDLTRMAIGWRTAGQLQLVSYRATMDLRRAVAGVDAQPLVRAATQLERNLSKSTVTGTALSGVLTRGYNAFFQTVEKLEPALSRAMQVGVLGALELEDAWLRTRITLYPITSAIEDATKGTDALGSAAEGAADVFRTIGTIVDGIAGGIRATADALADLQKSINRSNLPEEEQRKQDLAALQRKADAQRDAANPGRHEVFTSEGGAKPTRNTGQEILDDTERRAAAIAAGKDIGQGLVEGLDASAPAIAAAGARAGKGAVDGARAATQTHSPSEETKRFGRDLGKGEELGLDASRPGIQAAAERAMVPDVSAGGASGGGADTPGGIVIHGLQIGPFEVHGGDADDLREKLLAMAPELAQRIFRTLSQRAGLAVPGT